jgi:HlyD family secretion protein
MKINRKLGVWIGVIVVIAVILGSGWYFLVRPTGSLSAGLTTVTTAWDSIVNPGAVDTPGLLNSSGTVETTVLSIAPELPGKVLEVDFQEGDVVKAGAVLVHLDDSSLKIQQTIAEANLQNAKLSLQKLASPLVIANQQATVAQDKQAVDDAQQALDTQKYFNTNTDAIQNAQANLWLAQTALTKAQTVYDKVKYNNYLDASAKAAAYQTVYQYKLAYDNALAVYNLWTGVPNQEQVDLKTATLALANAKVAQDQAYLDALNGGIIPINATGAGIAQLQLARVNVQAAQDKLDLLNDQIGEMTIIAPVDGLVMTRSVDPGDIVNPSTELLSLARLNDLTITVYIPADSYGKIKLGQTATVTVDAFPGQTFTAAVANISTQPEYLPLTTQTVSASKSTVYAIQLQLNDATGKIKSGMPADVTFVLK